MQIIYFLPGLYMSSTTYVQQLTLLCTKLNQVHLQLGQLRVILKKQLKGLLQETMHFFMSTVKGTPAYWKQFLYDVLAMVKQLGIIPKYIFLDIVMC